MKTKSILVVGLLLCAATSFAQYSPSANSFKLLGSGTTELTGSNGTLKVEGVVVPTTTSTNTISNKTFTAPVINSPTGIVKGDVGLGNVLNVAQEPAITGGSTSQYLRGDKSWQSFNSAVLSATAAGVSGVTFLNSGTLQPKNQPTGLLFSDLFQTHLDGYLDGVTSNTGHVWSVGSPTNTSGTLYNGANTITSGTSTERDYEEVYISQTPRRMGVEFSLYPVSGTMTGYKSSLVLLSKPQSYNGGVGANIFDNSIHCAINRSNITCGFIAPGFTVVSGSNVYFSKDLKTDGTRYFLEVELSGSTLSLRGGEIGGEIITSTLTDSRIASIGGRYVMWEHYNANGGVQMDDGTAFYSVWAAADTMPSSVSGILAAVRANASDWVNNSNSVAGFGSNHVGRRVLEAYTQTDAQTAIGMAKWKYINPRKDESDLKGAVEIGYLSNSGTTQPGVSIGWKATSSGGVGIGYKATAIDGVALGYNPNAGSGIAIGTNTVGTSNGVAVGPSANGNFSGVALGEGANAQTFAVAVGKDAFSFFTSASLGRGSYSNADGATALGYNAIVPQSWDNTVEIGAGTATELGGLSFRGKPIVSGSGALIITATTGIRLSGTSYYPHVTSGTMTFTTTP